MKNYLKRYLDDEIEKYLEVIGAILIVGPKWCGKTTTGEHHAKSIIKLQDKDKIKSYLKWADIKPSKLLEGEKPIEWEEKLSIKDEIEESIFLGLRMNEGIQISDFKEKYNFDFEKEYKNEIEKLSKMELIEIDNNLMKLTQKGREISNSVFVEFIK